MNGSITCYRFAQAVNAARVAGRCVFRVFVAGVVCVLLACGGQRAWAGTELAGVFGDNMVLQADKPIEIWGTATPHASIEVSLGTAKQRAVVDANGNWSTTFAALPASEVAIDIQVQGDRLIRIENVLIGEVWLAAGQSNMAFALQQAKNSREELAQAGIPALRLYHLQGAVGTGAGAYRRDELARLAPQDYLSGKWQSCDRQSAATFSAVAYVFGKRLHERLQVPVGIVCPAVGGTPTESWIRREALSETPQLSSLVESNWLVNPQIGEWCRERAKDNLNWTAAEGNELLGDDLGPYHPYAPGYMWQAGIAPLSRLQFRGVIWYQGESNAETAELVALQGPLLKTLVTDWRTQLRCDDLPFLFVQLPAMGRPHWPAFRQCQLECSREIEHAGMIVTIDLGHPTNVHPTDKRPVGLRLANLALGNVYHAAPATEYSYPVAVEARLEGEAVRVTFEGALGGLVLQDGEAVRHFEVAGGDKQFVAAEARVEGSTIVVRCDDVQHPQFIRYAWVPYPTPAVNLFNAAGLPASPFALPVLPAEGD